MPNTVRVLNRVENAVLGAHRAGSARVSPNLVASLGPCPAAAAWSTYDRVLDLADSVPADGSVPNLIKPLYDGNPCELSVLSAIFECRPIMVGLSDGYGRIIAERPATIECSDSAIAGLSAVFGRMAELIHDTLGTADLCAEAAPKAAAIGAGSRPRAGQAAGHLASMIGRKLRRRVAKLARRDARWVAGFRLTHGAGIWDGAPFAPSDFTALPDGGHRYFADPFAVPYGEGWVVFVEEYPFATAKGIISAFTIDGHGRASAPQPVLEQPYHLSYPQVFFRDGQYWMLPETGANGTIELYRATRFPYAWERVATLMQGAVWADATIVEHDGKLWLFATKSRFGSSTWDQLVIYYADQLTGPWHPHTLNPVLVDARAARPAGAFVTQHGQLFRPAQDCSRGYGSGLSLCRVDALTPDTYSQTVVRTIAGTGPGISGCHTLNRCGALELIDIFTDR